MKQLSDIHLFENKLMYVCTDSLLSQNPPEISFINIMD